MSYAFRCIQLQINGYLHETNRNKYDRKRFEYTPSKKMEKTQ